jgi:hypothetical protein
VRGRRRGERRGGKQCVWRKVKGMEKTERKN